MDVFIDNAPFATEHTTLGAIVDAAWQQVQPTGRLIVEIRLDGRSISDEEMDQLEDQQPDAEDVQLITADAVELSLETLDEAVEALAAARDAQAEAADCFSADETGRALEHVRDAINVWQQVQLSIQHTAGLFDLKLDDLSVNGEPAQQIIEELRTKLTQVRDQLVNNDLIGLADTLGYEMESTIQTWTALIETLRKQIESRRGAQ